MGLLVAQPAAAARVSIEMNGIEGDLHAAALASLELQQYVERDLSPVQVRRLFDQGDEEIRKGLEPSGYYQARVERRLEQVEDGNFRATFDVTLGEPLRIEHADVRVQGPAADLSSIREALELFAPKVGERMDDALYESSKTRVDVALRAAGFLDAELVRHRVAVTRTGNTAQIDVTWESGSRYRFGPVRFTPAQFPEHFLKRYVAWQEGEYYSEDSLLLTQQRLVDADYFASVAVQPSLEQARDGVVPVDVALIPAKRSVYSASAYMSTDSGPGVQLGFERRWLNRRGHKFDADIDYSQRRQSAMTRYVIPRPGPNNRTYNIGIGYREEETDSSSSETFRIAANDSRIWRSYTRTVGFQFLSGDFEIADQQGSSDLLFAEATLSRKTADDVYFPLRGLAVTYGLRVAHEGLIADTSFVQARAEAKWIRPVGDGNRFIGRAALGAMTVGDFDALPPELRFFAGGDRSVRGFDYQEIGEMRADGGVIGGKYQAVASAEYEHYFHQNWGAAVFVDAGDAFNADFNANVGAGLGVRWKSPIGVVRLDVGVPVVTDREDHSSWRIHVVIGPDL